MSEKYLVRDIYSVETDISDWPKNLPESERELLVKAVLDVLDMCVPLGTYDLYKRVEKHPLLTRETAPVFKRGAVYDWLFACVVRAARAADCEQRWHPPEKPAAPAPKPARKPRKKPRKKPQNG